MTVTATSEIETTIVSTSVETGTTITAAKSLQHCGRSMQVMFRLLFCAKEHAFCVCRFFISTVPNRTLQNQTATKTTNQAQKCSYLQEQEIKSQDLKQVS